MPLPAIDQMRCNAKDGLNDWSRNIFGGVLTAASIIAAAHNADVAFRIAQKEWNIAKKYWHISNNWINYYKDVYAPLENVELREATKLKSEKPLYDVARGRARAAAWMAFKNADKKSVKCTSKYCTGRRQEIFTTLAAAQADALAMCDALGYRNERAYIEARDDVRFQRQYETVKRGRNIVADAPSFGEASAGIYGKIVDQAWEGLKGAGTFLGYTLNRDTPEYPNIRYERIQQVQQPMPDLRVSVR